MRINTYTYMMTEICYIFKVKVYNGPDSSWLFRYYCSVAFFNPNPRDKFYFSLKQPFLCRMNGCMSEMWRLGKLHVPLLKNEKRTSQPEPQRRHGKMQMSVILKGQPGIYCCSVLMEAWGWMQRFTGIFRAFRLIHSSSFSRKMILNKHELYELLRVKKYRMWWLFI